MPHRGLRRPLTIASSFVLAASAVNFWIVQAQSLVPKPVQPSDLRVSVERVGAMPDHKNPTSPVSANGKLLLIDQAGYIYLFDAAGSRTLLSPDTRPGKMTFVRAEPLLGVAANAQGSRLYVVFIAAEAPGGIPKRSSPRPEADAWEVLYQYDFDGMALSNPQPIVAFQVRSAGHTGGGLACLPDGSVIFATGDSGDAFQDGLEYPDDLKNHLSKILRITPENKSVQVVARGVRNVQRFVVNGTGVDARVDFIDIGGFVAEELNSIPVARLLADASTNHFGWGRRGADGKAREGLFYIDAGGHTTGAAPVQEKGFLQPVAQYGRESASGIAASGPVSSAISFSGITSAFGDLVTGEMFAVTGPLTEPDQDVRRVNLLDAKMNPVTLNGLAGGTRSDPRFFNFPDGTAGVLIEKTGEFFRLTEIRQASGPPSVAAPNRASSSPPTTPSGSASQSTGPRVATVKFTDAAITIDGRLDEAAWTTAENLTDFRFPWGDAARGEASSLRLLWSSDALYIGGHMADAHIVAAGTNVGAIYADDMFEMHISPDAAHPEVFYLYEANLNNIVNAQMRMSLPNGGNLWYQAWNSADVKQAVTMVRGDGGGPDRSWTVEIRIPFASLNVAKVSAKVELPRGWKAAVPPVAGASWKFNFARANRDTPTGPDSDFSAWSFNGSYAYGPGKANMHFHDQNNFGTLRFVK